MTSIPAQDRAIWATWYDLDEKDRDRYLDWAHGEYLPHLARQPAHAWVAHYRYEGGGAQMNDIKQNVVSHAAQDEVGQGSQYVLLIGAPTVHTFFNPFFDDVAVPARDMLALRRGVRTVAFSEEARVDGPALPSADGRAGPAPAIQMGTLRARSVDAEFDLIRWYAQYRLPSMAKMTGCVRTRKLTAVAGWARHGILYEFESLPMRLQHFEQGHESLALDPAHWTHKITRASVHAPGSPFIGARIWSSA
ncbi:hypothetical protein [Hydrogenophaga sp. BPS33]|uniref:hypothetical protein n=1 Tax=Hydrogenophaga sp. BPS33 TaxID=2651974 RepID=UPI00131FF85B|nr:hypothetical protein [Hydrogenophaga sp. BPS33]QHE87817.1 hypothetical protein F9K07_24430 [Hydrogenophaga sp. BPS33]